MNQVLEKPFIMTQNEYTEGLNEFVEECIRENKEAVQQAIDRMKGIGREYIIESFAFQIISLALTEKSRDELLRYIEGGAIFILNRLLVEGFSNTVK